MRGKETNTLCVKFVSQSVKEMRELRWYLEDKVELEGFFFLVLIGEQLSMIICWEETAREEGETEITRIEQNRTGFLRKWETWPPAQVTRWKVGHLIFWDGKGANDGIHQWLPSLSFRIEIYLFNSTSSMEPLERHSSAEVSSWFLEWLRLRWTLLYSLVLPPPHKTHSAHIAKITIW